MSIKGWPTQEKDDRLSPQYATVEPVRQLQHALSVLSHEFVREVGTDTVEANSTVSVINATGHAALAGDVIRITSGTLSGQEIKVYSVSTNAITLAEELSSAPALGVSFQILRHKYPVVESTGEIKVTGSFSTTEVATAADGGALPGLLKVAGGYDGTNVQVLKTDTAGELQVDIKSIEGTVDATNSTTTPLGGGAAYTGAWVLNTNLASIQVGIKADQNSATNGIEIQFSEDGVNVHHYHQYTYFTASGGLGYLFQPEFKYYRLKFTNGAIAQTSFTLVTTTRATALFPSQYRVSTAITNETQALMTKTVITGETTGGGGGFVNVKVSPSGALNTESTLAGLDAAVLGQETMANSLPVVIASDQTAIPATQSGTWNINNVSGTVSLPTGAATEAKQDTQITSLQLLDDVVATGGAAALTKAYQVAGSDGANAQIISTNASGHVNIADGGNTITVDGTVAATQSGTWNINNVSGTVSLPTGAATSANQSTMITSLQLIDDAVATNNTASPTKSILTSGSDGTNARAISVNASGFININNIAGTVSLPTGAATATNQTSMVTALQLIDNAVVIPGNVNPTHMYFVGGTDGTNARTISTSNTGAVNINNIAGTVSLPTGAATETTLLTLKTGRSVRNRARIDYTSTNVTTAAYTQLLASTSGTVNEVEIFDSSGQTLLLATGGAGSEADQIYIFPGGNGRTALQIANATRVAIKAVSATANSGEISVNFYS